MKNNKATILLVDDTETNIDILLELLGETYDLLVSLDGESALEIAQEEDIDLILLDIMMPKMNGFEVCRILKSQKSTQNIPVIFITAKTDEDSIEEAYEVGGLDYITKPLKPRELLARVKTQLTLHSLVKNLEYIASYDAMTQIYNRRKFFELAHERFENSQDDLFAVMIDIDKFKKVNDLYGHATGDEVIKLVTKTISQNIPDESIFGRIGGEEFALLSHSPSKEKLFSEIESIRKLIENLVITTEDGVDIKFTISEGISQKTEDINSLDTLLKNADKALYEAKGTGRNRVIFR